MQALQLIVSTSDRAELNLALEEHLFRSDRNVLLFYRNADAVVLGKHQNPWKEAHLPYCQAEGIQLIRRLSGGGTVYHDAGNLNFSFIRSRTRELIDFRAHIQPISQALRDLGVHNRITDRNDLFIGEHKISGNAEHVNQVRKRILHHGTLLYQSSLDRLRTAIHSETEGIETHAVDSVRSKVRSIREVIDLGPPPIFQSRLIEALYPHLRFTDQIALDPAEEPDVVKLASEKYQSWEWNFGQSPQFRYHSPLGILTVRKGRIIQVGNSPLDPQSVAAVLQCDFDEMRMQEQLPPSYHHLIPQLLP